MIGSLTKRISNISNNPCYHYIIKNCFNNIDVSSRGLRKKILTDDCIQFIKKIHSIQPSLTGIFLDYLVRRIISKKMNKIFNDTRANIYCNNLFIQANGINFDDLNIDMDESYKKTLDTFNYKTENILLDIFITPLSHSFAFGGILTKHTLVSIMDFTKKYTNRCVFNTFKRTLYGIN